MNSTENEKRKASICPKCQAESSLTIEYNATASLSPLTYIEDIAGSGISPGLEEEKQPQFQIKGFSLVRCEACKYEWYSLRSLWEDLA